MARTRLKPGVYLIRNLVSNKIYVGSSTRNMQYRWCDHLSQLRTQVHPNIHLQRSFNKHSEEVFEFSIIEHCKQEDCITREQVWMDFLQPEYNIHRDARNAFGQKRSVETCIKIGLSKLGNQYRTGMAKTENERAKISATLKAKFASGEIIHPFIGKTHTPEVKAILAQKSIDRTGTPYKYNNIGQFDLQGNYINTYVSMQEVAALLRKPIHNTRCKVIEVMKGLRPTAYGYKWKDLNVLVKSGELLEP